MDLNIDCVVRQASSGVHGDSQHAESGNMVSCRAGCSTEATANAPQNDICARRRARQLSLFAALPKLSFLIHHGISCGELDSWGFKMMYPSRHFANTNWKRNQATAAVKRRVAAHLEKCRCSAQLPRVVLCICIDNEKNSAKSGPTAQPLANHCY